MKQFIFLVLLACAMYGGWKIWDTVTTTSDVLDATSLQLTTVVLRTRTPSEKDAFTGDLGQFSDQKPDTVIDGIVRESYSYVTPALKQTMEEIVAQFSQKTFNQKLVTVFPNSMTGSVIVFELLGERGYKNDLYVVDTTSQHILRSKSNKIQNRKVVGFVGDYIIYHEGCVEGCTIPLNVIIQNWRSGKQVELGTVGEVSIYSALESVGYKTYQKTRQTYESQAKCPQPNCCDSAGQNCKLAVAVISFTQKVKKLP